MVNGKWRFMNKILLIIITVALITGLFSHPALAAAPTVSQILRVTPIILNISLNPGKTTIYNIKVDNLTDVPLPLTASGENFETTDEDGGYIFNHKDTQSNLSRWIKIAKPDAIIPAKQSQIFEIEITIPRQIALGGYNAMIFFTPKPMSNLGSQTIISRIGALALANIGVPDPNLKPEDKAQILNFLFGKTVYEALPISWNFAVKNKSLFYFTAKPSLTLTPITGGKPTKIEMAEKVVFPGKIRRFTQNYNSTDLKYGIYKAQLVVAIGGGTQILSTRLMTYIPLRGSLITAITLIIGWYLLSKRKNIKKAILVLFTR
jgi:hypothetical protein